MGQRRNMSEWLRPTEQAIRMPVAWRYLLGDGKRRYRRERSEAPICILSMKYQRNNRRR